MPDILDIAGAIIMIQNVPFWQWLVQGQNSAGVQAIIAGVATIAATVAGVFAVRTYRTSNEQIDLAKEAAAQTRIIFLESVRPHLTVELVRMPHADQQPLIIQIKVTNLGPGRAIDITGTGGLEVTRGRSLPIGGSFLALVTFSGKHPISADSQTFFLRYSSLDGRRFRTEVTVQRTSTILHEGVDEIFGDREPPSFEDGLRFSDRFGGERERRYKPWTPSVMDDL